MRFDGRVLVCGSRNFGVKVDGNKRYIDNQSLAYQTLHSTLHGFWTLHNIGFGSAHAEPFVVIEGGAMGADRIAGEWAELVGPKPAPYDTSGWFQAPDLPPMYEIGHETYPADWENHGKGAGPRRNQLMLDVGKPTLVLAFSHDFGNSKGTADMLDRASRAGIPVVRVEVPLLFSQETLEV